jgi:tetratricopeptide (TPR) repeat protein
MGCTSSKYPEPTQDEHQGDLDFYSGNYSRAAKLYKKCLKNLTLESQIDAYKVFNKLGLCQLKLNQSDEALKSFKKCEKSKECAELSQESAKLYENIGFCYAKLSEYPEALHYLEKSRQVYESILGKDHIEITEVYLHIAGCYRDMKKYYEAIVLYQKAQLIFERTLEKHSPSITRIQYSIGLCYIDLGRYSEALLALQQALVGKEKKHAKISELQVLYENLGLCYKQSAE